MSLTDAHDDDDKQASKAGPVLPPVARVAWDNNPFSSLACPLVALSFFSHGTHIYRIVPPAAAPAHSQRRPASTSKAGGAKGDGAAEGGQSSHALSLAASLNITTPSGGGEVGLYVYTYIDRGLRLFSNF